MAERQSKEKERREQREKAKESSTMNGTLGEDDLPPQVQAA